ncbi:MAG: flotillin [Candidatus Schekmanbacteria bacterium RBG_13_48_7]|uniref:Flotillin n=1 Tax=Candidatus Schekmanbacteria bacterium RBG_13_48_7 TaxID=1817878 RepID=A0A1F7RK40_9BACT|nr:MAG: flotillin [Candidatus Schekmanbacteria bacterium RBG_13_48_7]
MTGWIVFAAGGIVTVFFLIMSIFASRYSKVGPNEVLIISGRRHKDASGQSVGYRIVKGGGAFIWPIFEKAERLSLEVITLDVKTPEVYTLHGVPIIVDGIAQIKVKGDQHSISTAAEQFLSKGQEEIMRIALQTVEGHLRAILGTLTVEETYKNRDAFALRVLEVAVDDLANMGLTIISFTIRDIRDNEGYLDALGKPRIAQVQRDAEIGKAEASRDATIKSALAFQQGQQAKYAADTEIAQAERDYHIKRAEYEASVNAKKAEADFAYELQKNKTNQLVKEEEVKVHIIEKTKLIEVEEKEILRRVKELTATVEKPALAEQSKIQTLADAEKYRLETIALGQAEASKASGFAEAEILKAQGIAHAEADKAKGLADAEVVKAKGLSEAQAMEKKAEAWASYTQAAIVQMFIDRLPEIAREISAPLCNTDRIVVVSGGGESAGVSKITKDVTNIISQLPPVIESLSGVDLEKLVKAIPGVLLNDKNEKAETKDKNTKQ